MSSWGFVRSFVGKLSFVSALSLALGCASLPAPESPAETAVEVGPTLDSPHVIRVCVKQPGVPRHKDFWANDGAGSLILDDWELALYQRNGQRIYYFDANAEPESAQTLPIPHHTLKCIEPPRSVLSSNGKALPTKPTPKVQQAQPAQSVQQAQLAPKIAEKKTARVAEPPPCTNATEPGQQRRSRTTTTQTCVRSRTLKAPSRPAPAAVAKSEVESPALAQAAPEAAMSPSLADWKVGAPNFSVPGLDPQRVLECVGSLCHSRHQNFAPKGGKPAASGVLEQRSLSTGGGGGAKPPKGTTRKPPMGPKPAATAKPVATTKPAGSAGGPDAGKPFTRRQKSETQRENADANGGQTRCTNCTQPTVPAQQSQKGVTPPKNESQTDHIIPKARGGNTSPENRQLLCRDCNLKKGDSISK